jgi:hypothetical protein
MAAPLTVKFRSPWRWSSVSWIVCAAAFALLFSAASIYVVAVPDQRGSLIDGIALGALMLSSWLLVGFFVVNLRARRSWREGVALVADSSGITFPDWRGRTHLLKWSEIDSLHLLKAHGSLLLFVEGSYTGAAGNPVRFPTEELDTDPHTLVSSLNRVRADANAA